MREDLLANVVDGHCVAANLSGISCNNANYNDLRMRNNRICKQQ